jgi:hypothetical protein
VNRDEAVQIVTELWVGFWPSKERGEPELAGLIQELQQPHYEHGEVTEWLRLRWLSPTEKFAPNASEIRKAFLHKAAAFRQSQRYEPGSFIGEAIRNGFGEERNPRLAACNYAEALFRKSSRTPAYRRKYFSTLVGVLVEDCGMDYPEANNVAVEIFTGVYCTPPGPAPRVVSGEERERMKIANSVRARALPPPKYDLLPFGRVIEDEN